MPTIWIEDSSGKIFHFTTEKASWEGDYNSPSSAIPASKVTLQDRNTIIINDGEKTLTVNLAQNGRTGVCLQCGQCCSHPRKACPHPQGKCGYNHVGKHHVCEHLVEYPEKGGIGKPGGTACAMYNRLIDGYKTCVLYPSAPEDIHPWMTACAMRFE